MKKYMVFTDSDLDGAISFLVFLWFNRGFKDNIDVINTSITKFRNDYTKWLSKSSPDDYDMVYIFDLDVHDHKDLIDTKKHFIIDHHKTHVDNCDYKNAKTAIKAYSSTCKMLYKIFNGLYNIELSDREKKLILLGDDYDCYKLELPQTRFLNVVYWNTHDRFKSFVKNFYHGFLGFNFEQQNIIKLYIQEITKKLKNLEIYGIQTTVQGQKDTLILSTFTDKYVNEIADVLLKKYKACIAIIVNPISKHVSFRRSTECENIDLIKFVENVAEDGGGHEYAVGCGLTEKFIEFTRCLKKWII